MSHWLKAPFNPILMILAALSNENAGKNCTPNKLGFTKVTNTFELVCSFDLRQIPDFLFHLWRRIQETHPSMWRCTGSQLSTRSDCASGKDELCQSSTEVIRVQQLSQCVTKILEISRSLALWLARHLDPYSSDPIRMSNRSATILPIPFQLV